MENIEIYLDNNATTRPLPDVIKVMLPILGGGFGNPSSSHSAGERVREGIKEARRQLGHLIGADPRNIVFTSSGTEANNMALYSAARGESGSCRILTTAVEHSSIRKMCSHLRIKGVDIILLPVDSRGHIDLEELRRLIRENIDLVSIQWVNNETGVIQPLAEIVAICHQHGKVVHTDAAQAVGKLEVNMDDIKADLLSLTGHKFHSPQGIGAIYSRDKFLLAPIFFGGFQEDSFRPGTENVSGIVGMGKAAELRRQNLKNHIKKMRELRDYFESKILESVPNTSINGDRLNRICNTSNILFRGIDGRILLRKLDVMGIRCSQSSACTNSQPEPSHVLKAMGHTDEEAYSSIRFSFSIENTIQEVGRAADIIRRTCEGLH
jgi:cysteine desulfurase